MNWVAVGLTAIALIGLGAVIGWIARRERRQDGYEPMEYGDGEDRL